MTETTAKRHTGITTLRRPCAVPCARAWVAAVLDGWGVPGNVVTDTVLVVGELLSNAVRHGDGAAMTLEVTWAAGRVRCAVAHQGQGSVRLARPGDLAESGRGLVLVEALTCAWGTESVPGRPGLVVWFTVDAGETR